MAQTSESGQSGLMPRATPVELGELVDYGEGAVVSRTLARSEAGTLTVFAFARGQELSEHTAPFDALVQVLEGEAELVIGGEAVAARAGQWVMMPADVPHAVRAVEPFKMLLTMIRG
jgi:quercetin dioxygenase-like cupin family protein